MNSYHPLQKHRNTFRNLLSCLLLAILPGFLSAQTRVEAKIVNFKDAELDKSFSAYQVCRMDARQIYQLSKPGNRFHFTLAIDRQHSWDLLLDYHDLRGPNYREVALTEQGPKVLPRRPNITFRGSQGVKRETVRFTITPEYVLGMIEDGGDTWFVEPLNRILPGTRTDYYFVYRAADVLADPTVECTFTAVKEQQKHEEEHHRKNPEAGVEKMACWEVEMATAADFTMFQSYGSVQAVNDFIITVTNNMEPLYDDFNLDYLIVDQFVPTSAMANPWTTSDEAFDILDDFSAWAPVNFLTHDVGQIWTDRNIQGCGGGPDNFGLVGCAQVIGGICGAQRYNVCEDYSNSSNCLRVLSAHELGHLWDGVHGQSGPNTIMNPTIQCGATTWAAGNITRIQDHIDSRGCLSSCGTLCNIDVGAVIGHESCPDANDGSISALVSGNMATVSYTLTGPVNLSNGTGLFTNLPPGDYTLRAIDGIYNETCFDEVVVTVNEGVDNTLPMPVCFNPTVQLNAMGVYNIQPGDVYNAAASADNCGEINLQSYSPTTVSCSDVGAVIVTVTVNDGNGNTNTCQATVTVEDNIPPVAVCLNHTVTFNGEAEIVLDSEDIWDKAASSDNCGGVFFVSANPPAIVCEDLGSVVPVTVTIEDASGNTATCVSMVTVEGLPCGWSQQPNGINCVDGNEISYDVPTEVFTATSEDCYFASPYNSDEMAFAQHDLCGDGSLVAQVTSISGTSLGWAGLTMRESNAGGAKKVQLLTNLSNFSRREVRYTTNGTAFPQQFPSLNRYWLRLERQGNQFIGYTSANGLQWFQVMAVTVNMNACLEIGLVATNYGQNSTVTATFANVEVVDVLPLVRPANGIIQAAAPDFTAFPNPTTGELNLDLSAYQGHAVRLELYDVHGKAVKVVEIDAAERTERLDLSGFSNGLYLLRVKTIGTGVGAENVLRLRPVWPDATKRVVLHGLK